MRKINHYTNAKLMLALIDGTMTCEELAEHIGLHYVTVLQYTRELHRVKAAHIATWEPDSRGRHVKKVFKLGPGKDAKRPGTTPSERTARYRRKQAHQQLIGLTAGPYTVSA